MPASTAAGSWAPSATRPGTASTGTWSAAAGQQKALIYDSPVTKTTRAYTYVELRDEVATLGGVLQDLGVAKGDRVIIYMPMVPEAVIAMLACARIGAIHSVVFGGFAAPELATRIEDAKPVAILSASCGIEPGRIVHYKPLIDAAIELSRHKPQTVLMLQRPMAEASMVGRARPRLGERDRRRQGARPQGRLRLRQGDRPALYPLHVGHDGGAQGRGARQRRAHGRPQVDHEEPLRGRARRDLLGRLRRRLGGRPFLHLLRTAAARLHDGAVRGQARRHAGRRHVLARHRRARRRRHVHGAHRLPRHQEGGPEGRAHRPLRPQRLPHAVPGRRARRLRDHQMGRGASQSAGLRPLVADGNGLADLRQSGGPGRAPRQVRLADGADAGLRACRRSTPRASP